MPPWATILLSLLTPVATIVGIAYYFGGQKEQIKNVAEQGNRLEAIVTRIQLEGAERQGALKELTTKVEKMTSEWPQLRLDVELIKRTTSRGSMPAVRPGSYSHTGKGGKHEG